MKNPTPKIVGKQIEKLEMFNFTFSIEISRLYLLLRTDILQKTVVWCPCVYSATAAHA